MEPVPAAVRPCRDRALIPFMSVHANSTMAVARRRLRVRMANPRSKLGHICDYRRTGAQASVAYMKPLILLDIAGVLNPVAHPHSAGDGPELSLPEAKVSLVQRLSKCGRIAWVSTSPADQTAELESQLQLEVEPLRVELEMRESDVDEPTPKLRAVTRWLADKDAAGKADWDAVVWIDDVLGPDAHEWADGFAQPVLLKKTSPEEGLTKEHVASIETFVDGGAGG